MLLSLSVKNYVLIDSLEISFPEGLIIITGQTGAGKSVLLGALGLVLGAKADVSAISPDASSCVVEACFSIDDARVRFEIEEAGAEWDDGNLTIRRVVNRTGRSRSFVNDSPVPLPVLQKISSALVDVHSQHQTLILSDKEYQLSALDRYAGNEALLSSCAASWTGLQEKKAELAELKANLLRLREESDYIQARYEQLEKARLVDGELEELEIEQKKLANAEEIKEILGGISDMFSPGDQSERVPLSSMLREAARMVEKVSTYIPTLNGLSERLDSARIELSDILSTIEDADEGVELSSERLQSVEDRLALLYDLMRRFSCGSIAELIAKRESYGGMLSDTTEYESRIESLEKEIVEVASEHGQFCSLLHEARQTAAPKFAGTIEESLHSLELGKAIFEVEISKAPASATGSDAVCFKFSSTGRDAVDVARCASGGEKSRIMLSLKAMMARYTKMPTMIFDEIDTGVSGSAADKMGTMICSMGKDMQVFAITHQPQVAAKGSAHYVVEKKESDGLFDSSENPVTSIRRIKGDDRVMEIARMLSGAQITSAAIANARTLLG